MPSKVARRTSSWATSSSGGAGGATASHSATAASNGAHRRESSDAKTALVSHFFAELLHEAIVDTASDVHATLARQRAIRLKHDRGIGDGCPACGTACRAHPGVAGHANGSVQQGGNAAGPEPSTATSGAIPLAPKTDLYSNNPLLPCAVCARQVGSNRYAMHLSKCLNGGSGKASQRRKVALGASVKESAASVKQAKKVASALEARKRAGGLGSASGTPAPGVSDNESERTGGGGAWLNGNGKRGASPNGAASSKKARTSSTPPLNGSNAVGMSRTSSSNHLSATPISGSPLNPKKYQKNVLSGSGADGAFAKSSSHGKAGSAATKAAGTTRNPSVTEGYADADEGSAIEQANDDDDDDDDEPLAGNKSAPALQLANGSNSAKVRRAAESLYSDRDGRSPSESQSEEGVASEYDEEEEGAMLRSVKPNAPKSAQSRSYDSSESDSDAPMQDPKWQSKHAAAASTSASNYAKAALVRSKGSDGEFIDVDSASESSGDDDSF
ncbi:hypothetical protein IE81DRAFT_237400 [Ceraceosorus guamensis]|uniref:SAGA-associated factor 11 n=1 Tax=Ceraceosorus guamensis TaxID=1522189 RepID=A0A316VSF1_9BASI|nr:hypothetical protein IE81DRAFT_237400 [Ceraceosorus guamensis]PWN40144.1 hypothetical protein IE81DRAFT_237400 [Ceraceosorus guamensis]